MAEVVSLHGGVYLFPLPAKPTREEDVLFYDRPKKEQYWRPPVFPDLKRMSMHQRIHYVEDQRQKWAEGAWFFNNGEATYINGLHWDHLVNMTFKNKKAFYLDNQRKDFLFRELTWKDPFCKGRVFSKCRRYGMSMEEITEATYREVEDYDRLVGLVSIEEKKTKKSLFNPIVDSFVKRPPWMRPIYYKPNNKKPQQSLQLTSKDINDDDDYSFNSTSMELNGTIMPSGTTSAAFDAYEMDYIVADEIWKWVSASPKEFLETHLKCLEVGGEIKGLISLLSTLGDSKSQKKAIEEGIEIYRNSRPDDRDANGFTKTGLYPYFVSAVYSKFALRDLYGFIDEGRATEMVLNERNNHEEGSRAWVNAVRREPLTEDEALATAEGTTTFDAIRIEKVIKKIHILRKSSDKPFIENGELIEDSNGRVTFEDTGKGYWTIQIKPKKRILTQEDRSNRWKEDFDGFKLLTKSPEGAIGYDPVQFADAQTTSDSVSKAAIIAKYRFDYFGNNCANRYAGMWLNRDEDPDVPSYEAYKAAKFWGFPIMHEGQVAGVYKWFKEMKALDFLLKDPKRGTYGLWTDNQKNVIRHGVTRFQSYIKRPKTQEEMDWLETIGLLPLLEDAKKFDPLNTRKFDTFMANVMMEHGFEMIPFSNRLEEEGADDDKKIAFSTLFGVPRRAAILQGEEEEEEEY